MKSLVYKFPTLYKIFLLLNHGNNLKEIYKKISQEIGKNKSVLDLGCGTCNLFYFLDSSNEYIGFDLNKIFVNYCKKKGINIKMVDIFDFKKYPKVDIIVICGVLHHIYPRHELLLDEIKKRFNSKLIVCEGIKEKQRWKDFYFIKKSRKLFDELIGDNDGINKFEKRSKCNFTKKTLRELFINYNAKKIYFLKDIEFGIF